MQDKLNVGFTWSVDFQNSYAICDISYFICMVEARYVLHFTLMNILKSQDDVYFFLWKQVSSDIQILVLSK